MSGLKLEICMDYLDDIIVFSNELLDHLQRLRKIFERLRVANLKLKLTKRKLLQRRVGFLGHVVSGTGIATDPEKIKSVQTWPTPTSLKEVRSFLGLCSYYRRFVKGFSEIASPLHRLAGKNVPLIWALKCQQAFEELRLALTTTPVLAMPPDENTYIFDTHASHHAIGAVLSQVQAGKERVITYASRTYSKAKVNFCTTRQEILAVVHFVKQFKQYLLGRESVIRTDHAALTWLQRTPDIIGQQKIAGTPARIQLQNPAPDGDTMR